MDPALSLKVDVEDGAGLDCHSTGETDHLRKHPELPHPPSPVKCPALQRNSLIGFGQQLIGLTLVQ